MIDVRDETVFVIPAEAGIQACAEVPSHTCLFYCGKGIQKHQEHEAPDF
jgi:hypothetical protein